MGFKMAMILISCAFGRYTSQNLLIALQSASANNGKQIDDAVVLLMKIDNRSSGNNIFGYCDYNCHTTIHRFHSPLCHANNSNEQDSNFRCDNETLQEEEFIGTPFVDSLLLERLLHHHINILFGEERRLPAAYCGLSAIASLDKAAHRRSLKLQKDFYLQLNLDLNVSSVAPIMEWVWSNLQQDPSLFASKVFCSAALDEKNQSLSCDGKFLFTSLSAAQTLLTVYTRRVNDFDALNKATAQHLSEEDKLFLMQESLQVQSRGSSLELGHLDEDASHWVLSETLQPDSKEELSVDSSEVNQNMELPSLPSMSTFTNVSEKFVSDGSCRMGWPLKNSAVFVLDQLFWLNDDLPSLPILLYCNIFDSNGEPAVESDRAISVQVDFYIASEQYAPVLIQGRASDLRRAVLSVNLPRLRSRDREVDLTRVPSSVVVSVFSSRGSAVFAVLEADFHFEFPAIEQAENRPAAPNSFHSEMLMLGRDNLYALLNAMGLTGVAVEIGVYKGDFAMRMLRNWSGSRYVMVDPWRHWPDEEYPDDSNDPQEEQEERFRSVRSRVVEQQAAHPSSARAAILRLTSEQAADLFAEDSLDFCYIDAQHDFLSVLQDITRWWPKVRSGGIIADYVLWYLIADGILGHDFSRRRWVFPVALAALRFARVMKLQLFVTGEEDWASWYIFKP